MTGTIINALAILACGILALTTKKEMSAGYQNQLKILIGLLAIVFGFYAMWQHINGSFTSVLLQLFIVMISMTLGRLLGHRLQLQKQLNKLGFYAQNQFAAAMKQKPDRLSVGFLTSSILFCTGPMAIAGALMDGMFLDYKLLILKSIMDGLAAMFFVRLFGWSSLLAIGSLLLFQGAIVLGAGAFVWWIDQSVDFRMIPEIIGATCGLLMTSIGLVVLEVKKNPTG